MEPKRCGIAGCEFQGDTDKLKEHKKEHPNLRIRSKKCSRCDWSTDQQGKLDIHEKRCMKSGEIFTCENCGYRSGTSLGLSIHFQREHPGMKRKKKNLKIGTKKCSRCDYR